MIGTVTKWQRLIENFTFIRPGQAGGRGQQHPLRGGHVVPAHQDHTKHLKIAWNQRYDGTRK